MNRLRFAVVILVLLIGSAAVVNAQTQGVIWAKGFGGPESQVGRSVAVDTAGNVYVTGSFSAITTLGLYGLMSEGGTDIFVMKMDANGTVLWARSFGGDQEDTGNGIAVSNTGNVYITGSFSGTVNFGPYSLTSIGDDDRATDIFVMKLDDDGNVQWAERMGGEYWDTGNDIGVDTAGHAFVTGLCQGTADFGSIRRECGNTQVFVMKLDDDGTVEWAKNMGSPVLNQSNAIDVLDDGTSFIVGWFDQVAYFDGLPDLIANPPFFPIFPDMFVVKLDPNGTFLWARGFGGTYRDEAIDVAVNTNGDAFVTGGFSGTVDFDTPWTISSSNSSDIFVVRMDGSSGTVQWAVRAGGNDPLVDDYSAGQGVSIDPNGNVWVTGFFTQAAIFGTIERTASSYWDTFVATLDLNGTFLWADHMGSWLSQYGHGIATDTTGNALITGAFLDSGIFGPYALTDVVVDGQGGAFVQKVGILSTVDADGDGYTPAQHDCNDTDPNVHPEVVETCNGIDDNCDGPIDVPALVPVYRDRDHDGYGTSGFFTLGCPSTTGLAPNADDCDDTDPSIRPGIVEVCNGIDDNCVDGADEGVQITSYPDWDGDGYGDPNLPELGCVAPIGFVTIAGDCDDTSFWTHPGAAPNDDPSACMKDEDWDWYGDANPPASVSPGTDCNDTDQDVQTVSPEVTDLIFTSTDVLQWTVTASTETYHVYRSTSGFPSSFACDQSSMYTPSVEVTDTPELGTVYFYLVTAGCSYCEGTLGFQLIDGVPVERPNTYPCP